MTYLITGARGQLGQEFCQVLTEKQKNFTGLSRAELDVTDFLAVKEALTRLKPQVVINCSAYNLVDLAEEKKEQAHLVNEHAVGQLAALCAEKRIKFVHFSTDYVFDGKFKIPYREESQTSPINIYGLSKLLGEEAIRKTAGNYLIFRSSWIYGNGTQNFIYKLLQWAKEKDTLPVAFDETSIPNWTRRIAWITLQAIEDDLEGLFHLSCDGFCSRYELAQKTLELVKLERKLIPVTKNSFALKAKRGEFLALSNQKIASVYSIPHWQEDLEKFLRQKPFG